jgi:hypothetical protein
VGAKLTVTAEVVVPLVGVALSQIGSVLGFTVKKTAGLAEREVVAGV